MNRLQLIALLCGVCLLAQPFVGSKFAMAEEEEYADEVDDVEEEADQETSMNEEDVVVATTKNFDSLIKQHKYALVEFYAPWCGHCKSLAPEYAKAATKMKSIDPSILIAKVDATVETELAEKHGVAGYPTLKWFVDGVASDYNGGRDEDAIVSWIKKKTGPPAVMLTSTDALSELEKEEEVLLVAYLLKGDSYKAFISVAEKTDSVAFAETVDKAVGKAVGLTQAGVAIVKNFKGEFRQVMYVDQPMTKESLETAILEEKLPLTLEFNQANSERIFGAGIPRHILMLAKEKDLEIVSKTMITLREVATAFKGKFVFVTVNADSSDSEPVVKFFELDKEVSPSIVGFKMEPKQQKFKFHEDFTVETLTKFCNSLLDGSLQPEYKSEEVKENDKDGEVVVVVGKSFDKIAKDPTKDVLLEVYAPWCGHCKSLAPIYKKLAKRFKDVDSVVIAKMDGTANEHAELDVQGFPTIIFYPAEEGAIPIPYNGERTLKDLTKFIKENAKIPYELKKKSKAEAEEDEEEKEKDEL